ncbi:MAG: polyprenyl synthetase, partial [Proteobacteria bacterium]|nr:polyprenyl synthetase [Pseudomonadota bacterium]
DVIDDGQIRRGQPTVNVVWDSLTAVLAGDLLLSESIKGLHRCPRIIAQEALDVVSEMTRATMLESHLRGSTTLTKQQWLYIARGKTASMFRWCGRSAAFLGNDPEAAEKFGVFGDHFGIAFQMADDLLDVQYSGSGKTPFADIRNKNPSYPILLAMQRDPNFRLNLIEAWKQPTLTEDEIVSLGSQILATGAGQDTLLEVHAQVEKALNAIDPYLNRPGCSSIARWAQTLFERFAKMKAV